MTVTRTLLDADRGTWLPIGPVHSWIPWTGRAALIGDVQVAIFRVAGDSFLAIDNHDPCSGANVLSRGIVGAIGAVTYVASPIRKQRFALVTGECLDEPDLSVATHRVRVRDGYVHVLVPEPTPSA